MCNRITKLLQRPVNIKRLFDRGGLQALARIIKRCNREQNPWFAAAENFMGICDHIGDAALPLLEEQVCFEALLEMAAPHPHFTSTCCVLCSLPLLFVHRLHTLQHLIDACVLCCCEQRSWTLPCSPKCLVCSPN
jgi:hypothetical protein